MLECILAVGSLSVDLRTPGISPVASSGTGASSGAVVPVVTVPLQGSIVCATTSTAIASLGLCRDHNHAQQSLRRVRRRQRFISRSGPHPTPGRSTSMRRPLLCLLIGGLVRPAVQ
jgi:hypothetical protein